MRSRLVVGLCSAAVVVAALSRPVVGEALPARAINGPAAVPIFESGGFPVAFKATPDGHGYYRLGQDGTVHSFGGAVTTRRVSLRNAPVALAVTKTGNGVWVFDSDGCVATLGDAQPFTQSICGMHLNAPVIDAATTPDGGGYWLVAGDGGVFSFGDAGFYGSTGGMHLNAPIVGFAPTPSGTGYWEVAADGGVFAFHAPFLGSMGATRLAQPVVGMVASGTGYLMVASDGGVFNFGNPFYGSLSGVARLPIVQAAPSFDPSGAPNGYWMVDSIGQVYALGSAWAPGWPGGPQPVSNGCTVLFNPQVLPGDGTVTRIGIEVTTPQLGVTGTLQIINADGTTASGPILTQGAPNMPGSWGELVGVAGLTGEVVTYVATFPSIGATCLSSYVFR